MTTTTSAAPAADGADVAACEDGTCEVEVATGTEIPLAPQFGIDRLFVEGAASTSFLLLVEASSGARARLSTTAPRPGAVEGDFRPLVDSPLQVRLVRLTEAGRAVIALRPG